MVILKYNNGDSPWYTTSDPFPGEVADVGTAKALATGCLEETKVNDVVGDVPEKH